MSDRYDDLVPWPETYPTRYPLPVDPRSRRSPLAKPPRKTKQRRGAWLRRMWRNIWRCARPELAPARMVAGGKWRAMP